MHAISLTLFHIEHLAQLVHPFRTQSIEIHPTRHRAPPPVRPIPNRLIASRGVEPIRQLLHPLNVIDSMEFLLDKVTKCETNQEFLDSMNQ